MSALHNWVVVLIYSSLLLVELRILYVEIIKNQFRNYATSMFHLAFTALFIAVPIAVHVFIGGAETIVSLTEGVHEDVSVYLIYSLCVLSVVLPQLLLSRAGGAAERQPLCPDPARRYVLVVFVALMGFAFYLYVRSSGLSVVELARASRFSWFASQQHSLFADVIASYLLAVAPLVIYKSAVDYRKSMPILAGALVVLLVYGICMKDRKWLIYIISGLAAAYYTLHANRVVLRRGLVVAVVAVSVPLVFWQIARDTLFVYALGETTNVQAEAKEMAARVLRSGDAPYYYRASVETIVQSIENDVFVPLAVVRRQLFFYLPSKYSLGLKPEDLSAVFSDIVHGGNDVRRGNMPPGFFGLFVISFKWYFSPLILALVPFALRRIDRIIQNKRGIIRDVILSIVFSSVVLLLRGDDSGAFYFVISNTVIASIVTLGGHFYHRDGVGRSGGRGAAVSVPKGVPRVRSDRDLESASQP